MSSWEYSVSLLSLLLYVSASIFKDIEKFTTRVSHIIVLCSSYFTRYYHISYATWLVFLVGKGLFYYNPKTANIRCSMVCIDSINEVSSI